MRRGDHDKVADLCVFVQKDLNFACLVFTEPSLAFFLVPVQLTAGFLLEHSLPSF